MNTTTSIQTIGTIIVRGYPRAAFLRDGQVFYFGGKHSRGARLATVEQAATFEAVA